LREVGVGLRLFQSGGMMALANFGCNRYLIMEPEKGNRFAVTFAQCPFLYMATLAFSRIIPAFWTHRSIVISLYSDIVMECLACLVVFSLVFSLAWFLLIFFY
jgi:hypothetical protein